MRKLLLLFLLIFTITNSFCQVREFELSEVEVKEKAIPEITILGIRYSYKERDYFIKTLLAEPFWRKDFKMKLDLSYFYKDKKNDFFLIKGKTTVKIDSKILSRNHKYKSYRKIKGLLSKMKKVSINQNNLTQVIIETYK
tara:strand:+ start:297 stop:716 length:420 start_codon:yes stop_codon:yes gene_type:complete